MATTTSEPPPTTRHAHSPEPSTTRESFAPPTQTVGRPVPRPADLPLLPVVLSPQAECQDQEQVAMTPALHQGCPTPPTPSSTPSPGWLRASKHPQIQLYSHLEITPETAACWTATLSWPTTTTDTPPSIPPTAWVLPRP